MTIEDKNTGSGPSGSPAMGIHGDPIRTGITFESFQLLEAELRRARGLHPGGEKLFQALVEEVGELAKAMIEGGNWKEEAIHVATVAIRIVEEGATT